jgi:hypothetical protein
MKSIDIKSLIIGVLLTSTIFLGVAATSKDDKGKWDENQQWEVSFTTYPKDGQFINGWEPYAVLLSNGSRKYVLRKRIK